MRIIFFTPLSGGSPSEYKPNGADFATQEFSSVQDITGRDGGFGVVEIYCQNRRSGQE